MLLAALLALPAPAACTLKGAVPASIRERRAIRSIGSAAAPSATTLGSTSRRFGRLDLAYLC